MRYNSSVERDQPITGEEVAHVTLNLLEARSTARLALEMIEECGKSNELLSALSAYAVIELRGMARRIEMLIEPAKSREFVVAEIAFEEFTIPGTFGSRVGGITMPFEQLIGDHAARIAATELFEDGFAIKAAGIGARSSLQMVGDAAGGHEASLAERAGDICAAVGARITVL